MNKPNAPGEGSEGEINAQRNSHSQAEKGSEGIPRAEAKGQRVEQSSGLERSHERSSQIGEGSELPATLVDYLKEIGIEGGIEASRIEPLRQERLWNVCEILFKHLKAALSSPQQEWIDCKQKMPEEKGRGWFLITNGNRVDVGLLLHGKTFMGHALQFEEVTHWQPLPAPPVTAEGKDRG